MHEVHDLNVSALLAPKDDISWMKRGKCVGTHPDTFFPEQGQSSTSARDKCVGCPVRVDCLRYALRNEVKWGIWGNTSWRERRKILKRQREAREHAAQLARST